jgi:hypothetical protein
LQLPDALLNSWLLVQSQVVVAGTYLVSLFTKILSTGGMWLWNANYIAIDLIKTQRHQPVSVRTSMPLPVYLIGLINSLSVWADGNWMDILRFTLPMWTTCLVTAAAGAMAAYLLSGTKRSTSVF